MLPSQASVPRKKASAGFSRLSPKWMDEAGAKRTEKEKKKSSSGAIQRVSHFLHAFVLPEADKAQKGSAVSGIAVWSRYVWVTYAMAGPRDSLAGGGSLSLLYSPRYIYIYIFTRDIDKRSKHYHLGILDYIRNEIWFISGSVRLRHTTRNHLTGHPSVLDQHPG